MRAEGIPKDPGKLTGARKPMNTASEAIRKLLLAHFQGDEAAFRSAALEFVENERRLNHHTLANDLERILSEANGPTWISEERPRPDRQWEWQSAPGQGKKCSPRRACRPTTRTRRPGPLRIRPGVARPHRAGAAAGRPPRVARDSADEQGTLLRPARMREIGRGGGPWRELYLPLATVRFDAVVSSYLGETAANLRKVFEFGRSRPLVLLFDEFDAIGKERTAADEHGELKRVVNSFLQLLDGFHAETLTIAATNHQGLLDPALWRRFDEIVVFPRPTREEIEQLLSRHFRQLPVERQVVLADVARSLEGFSHADVERVALDTLKQTILDGRDSVRSDTLDAAVARQRARLAVTDPGSDSIPTPAAKPRGRGKRSG